MARVAVLGEQVIVAGYALAGAVVVPAEDADAVRTAWDGMADDIAVVVLTPAAADALGPDRTSSLARLAVVMPP
jgi:vacuolar-type H+-ATPase subunit F/Vma7